MWEVKKGNALLALIYLSIFAYLVLSTTYLVHLITKIFFPNIYATITFFSFFIIGFFYNIFLSRSLIYPLLNEGEYSTNSLQALMFGVGALANSFFLYPVLINSPPQFKKIILSLIGLKLKGQTVVKNAVFTDPYLTKIGKNFKTGAFSGISGHNIKSGSISLKKVIIGDNVTLGDNVIIYPNVNIENNAEVISKSIVTRDTNIKEKEVWGGIPAKFIKKLR